MTKKQLREKINKILKDHHEVAEKDKNAHLYYNCPSCGDQLLVLIDQYADEARIDELEHITGWTINGVVTNAGGSKQYTEERLESLKKEKKGGIEWNQDV